MVIEGKEGAGAGAWRGVGVVGAGADKGPSSLRRWGGFGRQGGTEDMGEGKVINMNREAWMLEWMI